MNIKHTKRTSQSILLIGELQPYFILNPEIAHGRCGFTNNQDERHF